MQRITKAKQRKEKKEKPAPPAASSSLDRNVVIFFVVAHTTLLPFASQSHPSQSRFWDSFHALLLFNAEKRYEWRHGVETAPHPPHCDSLIVQIKIALPAWARKMQWIVLLVTGKV